MSRNTGEIAELHVTLVELARQVRVNAEVLSDVLEGRWGENESKGIAVEEGVTPSAEEVMAEISEHLQATIEHLRGLRERLVRLTKGLGQ